MISLVDEYKTMQLSPANTTTGVKSVYKVLFLCFVACGLYYPSLFSQFNSIDDAHIISYLEDTNSSLLDILLPGKSHYYRPVIWLTFFFDKYVWGLEPSFMHLENIFIHAVNAVLVYLLAARIAGTDEQRLELPFLAALLFTVHPINTEAVCWIAGRTDPLATVFILLAAWYLADPAGGKSAVKLIIPAGCIFIGCLVKEVAFFFFPVAALAAIWLYSTHDSRSGGGLSLMKIIPPMLPFALLPAIYLWLRRLALPAEDKSVTIMLTQHTDFIAIAATALKAFGFYVKKLFLPFPLNFAIVSYSNGYMWFGIAVIICLGWLLWQRRLYFYLLGCSLFLVLPAVIVATRPIAWTPVAERYLYAPSAFFVIACAGSLSYLKIIQRRDYYLPLFLTGCIIFFSFVTVQRNLVWQDNYLLYKDAVSQSPQFARIRNEYGIALAEKGRSVEASQQFEAGSKLADKNYQLPVLNLANVKFREGKTAEALTILSNAYKDRNSAPADILKLQARIYEYLLFKTTSAAEQKKLVSKLIDIYHYIYLKDKNPYILYRSGQLLLVAGESQKAAAQFKEAAIEAPDDAYYKQPAKKLADKLRSKK